MILKEWQAHASHEAKISQVYLSFQPKIEQKRKTSGFQRLLACVNLQKKLRENAQKAEAYHFHKTWLKVKAGWMDRVILNKTETLKVVKIRNMLKKKRVQK